ncbi:MAG: hypothetical protein ACREVA_02225 [Burkholderiales bacterium]
MIIPNNPPEPNNSNKNSDFIQGGLANIVTWFTIIPGWLKAICSLGFLYLIWCFIAQVQPADGFKLLAAGIDNLITESRVDTNLERTQRVDMIQYLRAELEYAQVKNAELQTNLEGRTALLEKRLDLLEYIHVDKLKNYKDLRKN